MVELNGNKSEGEIDDESYQLLQLFSFPADGNCNSMQITPIFK